MFGFQLDHSIPFYICQNDQGDCINLLDDIVHLCLCNACITLEVGPCGSCKFQELPETCEFCWLSAPCKFLLLSES